jgi:hypothetical protein
VVEGARLESVYAPKGHRGFESLPLCEKKIEPASVYLQALLFAKTMLKHFYMLH